MRLPEQFCKPIEQTEFRFCFSLAAAAGSYQMPMESPASTAINIDMGNGEVETISFTDIPMNRAALAIREHIRSYDKSENGIETFQSIMYRILGMSAMLNHRLADRWIVSVDDTWQVHEAVIDAAAVADISTGDFIPKEFFATVERIAMENYPDTLPDQHG